MSALRIKSLKIGNFRSFYGANNEVSFPGSGLCLIRGKNVTTGGSSGAGKSSLFHALTYLFDINPFPANSLQNWDAEEDMSVEGNFERDGKLLRIVRGPKGYSATIDGETTKGAAETKSKITNFLGVSTELLEALTYREQKSPGLFLSKKDSEKKSFLTQLLDLSKFEREQENSEARVKELEKAALQAEVGVTTIEQTLQSAQIAVNLEQGALSSLPAVTTEADADTLRERITKLDAKLALVASNISDRERNIEFRIRASAETFDKQLAELQNELQVLLKQERILVDRSELTTLRSSIAEGETILLGLRRADAAESAALDRKRQNLLKTAGDAKADAAVKLGSQVELANIQKKLETLKQSICHTCLRPWENAGTEKEKLEARVAQIELDLLAGQKRKKEAEDLTAEAASLKHSPNPEIAELEGMLASMRENAVELQRKFDAEEAELNAGSLKLVEAKRLALSEAKAEKVLAENRIRYDGQSSTHDLFGQQDQLTVEWKQLTNQLNTIEAAIRRRQMDEKVKAQRLQVLKENVSKQEALLDEKRKLHSEAVRKLNVERDFQQLIGRSGFLASIFDEVLWEIAREANQMLARVPNTAHVVINFRSENETQKGTIQKKIVPVVSISGHDAPLKTGLSGGMETAVELAVDLAVSSVISRRTGATPGWMILDECFGGLGPIEMEACLELLQVASKDRLMLVVDHASEFKSMFSQFIDIAYEKGASRFC